MKFNTTRAPRIVTTAKVPDSVIRSDREIAALVAKYRPMAVAHAKAKFAATQWDDTLASLRASVAKLRTQAATTSKESK